ncbi:MAG TPA: GxGYxYP domain-containing protein, partial [Armatimonadota bacterium]|nr:GxGYxYP domain-containing protein [Armatimonadota bacterium]
MRSHRLGWRHAAALLVLLTALPACAAPTTPANRTAPGGAVAIFSAQGFPYYGGSHYLSPEVVAADLRRSGVNAQTLGLDALSSLTRFNRRRYALFINLYGNTFPIEAYPNLRRFHLAGGGIISTAVPFTHPVRNVGAAFWSASPEWGQYAAALRAGGASMLRLVGPNGTWSGVGSARHAAHPGETVQIAGRIRTTGPEQGRDFLYVRFYNQTGQFLTQIGPAFPASAAWRQVSANVRVPKGAAVMDVSPQVWTPGVTAWLTGLSLRLNGRELLANGSFQQPGDGWQDLGHTDRYLGDAGMGLGGFGGPTPGARIQVATGNPIRLARDDNPYSVTQSLQYLDPTSLPAQNSIIPIITAVGSEGKRLGYPAALIVRHDAFAGAVDGWAGTVGRDDSRQIFFVRQVVEREAVEALRLEGAIPASAVRKSLTHLAAEPVPPPAPHDLPLPTEHRPYSTFFPVSPPLARHLLVADVQHLNNDDRLLLTSLQGLVNRRQPRIFLLFGPGDATWLHWMQQEGDTGAPVMVLNPMSLVRRFRSEFHGAVIPDPALYIGVDIAADVSGADSLLIANPAQVHQYGLTVKADLRGRFHSDAGALSWVADHLYPHLNHFLMMVAHPDLAYNGSFDYMIQHKGIIFWISGSKDGVGPGRDPLAEQQVMERLFARMPVNIPVRGFWWHGNGVGIGEGPGVTLGSRFGKVTVVSDGMTNISVHSGIRAASLKQPKHAPPPPLDRSKVYYTFTMSDGDNLDTHFGYFMSYVLNPLHGKIP